MKVKRTAREPHARSVVGARKRLSQESLQSRALHAWCAWSRPRLAFLLQSVQTKICPTTPSSSAYQITIVIIIIIIITHVVTNFCWYPTNETDRMRDMRRNLHHGFWT